MCLLSGLIKAAIELLAGAKPPLKRIFDCSDSFGRLASLFAVMNLAALVPVLLLGGFGGFFSMLALVIAMFAVMRLLLAIVPISGSDIPLRAAIAECILKTARKSTLIFILMGLAICTMLLSIYSLGLTNIIALPFIAMLLTNIYRRL
jgi:hypothetical protein